MLLQTKPVKTRAKPSHTTSAARHVAIVRSSQKGIGPQVVHRNAAMAERLALDILLWRDTGFNSQPRRVHT